MAVIHISEAEAANHSLPDLIQKVRAGDRVEIKSGSSSFALVPSATTHPGGWTTLDALRQSEARGSESTADEAFADDLEEITRFNREDRFQKWE